MQDEEDEPVQMSKGGRSSKKSSPDKRTPKTKTPRAKGSTTGRGKKQADSGVESGKKSPTEKKRGRPAGKASAASKASGGRKSSTRKTAKQKREEAAELLRQQ